jgi:hypothetical protein
MRLTKPLLVALLSTLGLAGSTAAPGLVGRSSVSDPYYRDTHRWSYGEERRYRRWEGVTNRRHLEFTERSAGDQLAYWDWWHGGRADSPTLFSEVAETGSR